MKYFTYFGWLWQQHRKQFVKSLTKPELGHLNSIPFRYVGVGVEMNNLVSHILVQVEHLLSLHWTLNVCFVIFFQPPLTRAFQSFLFSLICCFLSCLHVKAWMKSFLLTLGIGWHNPGKDQLGHWVYLSPFQPHTHTLNTHTWYWQPRHLTLFITC